MARATATFTSAPALPASRSTMLQAPSQVTCLGAGVTWITQPRRRHREHRSREQFVGGSKLRPVNWAGGFQRTKAAPGLVMEGGGGGGTQRTTTNDRANPGGMGGRAPAEWHAAAAANTQSPRAPRRSPWVVQGGRWRLDGTGASAVTGALLGTAGVDAAEGRGLGGALIIGQGDGYGWVGG
jgi:hypothetical protein